MHKNRLLKRQGSTDRQVLKFFSVLVRFGPRFQNFVGPGPGGSKIRKFFLVLVRFGLSTRTDPLGPGPTGFGP